jgi:hypothetical protein
VRGACGCFPLSDHVSKQFKKLAARRACPAVYLHRSSAWVDG